LLADAGKYEIGTGGGVVEVKVKYNVEFDVQIPQDVTWVTQTDSRALTEKTIYLKVAENTTTDDRQAEITLAGKDSVTSQRIVISQEGIVNGSFADGVVTFEKPGTMKRVLGDDYLNITSLKVVGPMNSDDARCLRQMSGGIEFEGRSGRLASLDLSDATIVAGGEAYYDVHTTSPDAIGNSMFHFCNHLQDIVLPTGLTSIGEAAFYQCPSLVSVHIPASVTYIGRAAFLDCHALASVHIADHIKNSADYEEHIQATVRPYDKAISYYIKTFVHPEDMNNYREMTTIDYICEHITPDQPYYFVTYRQVIGTSCKWYRLYVTSTSFGPDGVPVNAILSTMDINDEQKKISKTGYYKNMFISASMGVYDRILQVNINDDKVLDIAFSDGEMLRVDTGLTVKEHLERFEATIAPEYREAVISTCRSFIAKSNPGDAISYGYKTVGTEVSESGWFVTTLRAMIDGDGDKVLMIFITDNTDKVKQRDMLEEKRRSDLMNNFIVNVLSSAVEFRSLETGDHVNRVIDLTRVMLNEYVLRNPDCLLTEEDIHKISGAAALHDVGKIAIADSILLKKGKLTPEEYEEMKKHTVYGCKILERFENKNDTFYRYCYDICRHHHERYDGRGYPDGLKGDEIPLWAQIVSIIDVYDALISVRTYKPAYTPAQAVKMINEGECGTFSPKVLECFNSTVGAFLGVRKE
jgi:HD-GYP domain-containing protein (c-di-GMP phosphodiesterase class II)